MTNVDIELCTVCDLPEHEHGEGRTRHPFTKPGEPDWVPPAKKEAKKAATPMTGRTSMIVAPMPDLVLRNLLVSKGIVTQQELEEVEHGLKVGSTYANPVPPDAADR